ncbi:AraC-like DNA-binding protein [Paenibacillus phyllosphaerae]|uniref:AraC-like DNA-binding protein n=1 Tax=Paenibacillus phyllosphaerae TaxID=274593 RepID=A0A7W5AZT9_9BACL|nr:AraC family transcriptional regulator [Paenibacillus phyllosphaerae]MBB3111489.1 AraC-like DNA-binding protein [Paenibacillus phyllosphaerae]
MEQLHYHNDAGTLIVSHRKAQSHHMPVSHFHSTYEIFYLMSGQREFFIQDRTIVVNEGDMVIVSPNILHRTTDAARTEHERFIVNIHPSSMAMAPGNGQDVLLPLLSEAYVIVRSTLHERQIIDELVRTIQQEIREQKQGFEFYALTLAQQLLIRCCRHAGQGSAEPLVAPSPMHERISEIVRYINNHYMEELSLQRIADHFFVSPYYLSRTFKEATGFTFVEYLNSVRIKEAKQLLEHSSMKVGSIARKVGFGSVTHFGRVFKEITGYVPLHYRKVK